MIDTNCLLRMIPLRSKYRLAWESFLDGKYTLCISNEIVSEYMETLAEKVNAIFAANIVGAILRSPFVLRLDPQFHFNLIEADPDDNKFVDCAIIANADFIVSDDSHFRVLQSIPFPRVNVLTSDEFSNTLQYNK